MQVMSISLTQGKRAYFDSQHLDLINQHIWYAARYKQTFYAQTSVRKPSGTSTTLKMHRLIMGLTDSKIQVDHIDHDGLNNLDSNLRLATTRQNCSNLRNKSLMSSQYTGVCWNERYQKWHSQIRIDGKTVLLGLFDIEKDAAVAYQDALRKLEK